MQKPRHAAGNRSCHVARPLKEMDMPIVQRDEYVRKVSGRKALRRGLAVGDSWFQYPLRSYGDIQHKLANRFHRNVAFLDDSVPGRDARTLPGTVLPRLTRVAAYLQELDKPIEVILASCGGNDVIGRDFATHLRPAGVSTMPHHWPWSPTVPDVALRHVRFDALKATFQQVETAYRGLLTLRDAHAPNATIITHTYADVVPSNRAYRFAFMVSGPWLWKPMQDVALTDRQSQQELSRWLLQSFHALLQQFETPGNRFVVLDTRRKLPDHKLWENEIHPNNRGFQSLVDEDWAPAVERALGM
jgi:hypothetical protein